MHASTHTRTHIFWPSGLCSGLTGAASARTYLDFTEARDSEWQRHQLGHMQIYTSPRQITMPTSHHSVFTGWMPFLLPNQQHQSIEGNHNKITRCNAAKILHMIPWETLWIVDGIHCPGTRCSSSLGVCHCLGQDATNTTTCLIVHSIVATRLW